MGDSRSCSLILFGDGEEGGVDEEGRKRGL